MTYEEAKEYADRILRAAGSALRHYMPDTQQEIINAMRKIMVEIEGKT